LLYIDSGTIVRFMQCGFARQKPSWVPL